jgi:hypothetical protein
MVNTRFSGIAAWWPHHIDLRRFGRERRARPRQRRAARTSGRRFSRAGGPLFSSTLAHKENGWNRCSRADHVTYAQIWWTLSRWSSGVPYDDWASSNCASSSRSRTAHSCAYGPKKLTTSTPSSRTRQPSSSPMMTKTRCFIGPPLSKTSGPTIQYHARLAHSSARSGPTAFGRPARRRSHLVPRSGRVQMPDRPPMRIVFRDTEAFAGLKCQRKTT